LGKACDRLNIESTRVKSSETALEIYQNSTNGGQQLIIVDGRNKNIDIDSFGRFDGLFFN
jgi:hypothetical protein